MKPHVKARWSKLREALLDKKIKSDEKFIDEFDFIENLPETNTFQIKNTELKLTLYPPVLNYNNEILTGFNNTGNVKIWPAESTMTAFLINLFKYKTENPKILELGGGYSSMALQFLAKFLISKGQNFKFYLSDGNEKSVEHCKVLVEENDLLEKCESIVIKWGENLPRLELDYIIISDCFFFDNFRQLLVDTLIYYLTINSKLIIYLFGPSRNGTFEHFQSLLNGSKIGSKFVKSSELIYYPN